PGFEEQFDGSTLFYDVVSVEDHLLFIGPPLWNLRPTFNRGTINDRPVEFSTHRHMTRSRSCDVWIRPASKAAVRLKFEFGSYEVRPQASAHGLYKDRRVLFTLSSNNELTWIVDWIHFHVRHHGADAVLLYDNASTKYDGDQLEKSLREAFPRLVINVVEWPYKYGPQGVGKA